MQTRTRKTGRYAALATALAAALMLTGCETPGKVGETSVFDVSQASPEDIAKALDQDGKVVLRGVLFETDSARLSTDGADATARLAEVLNRRPDMKLAVVGHTDSTGAFRYNLDLSRRRAEAMTTALVREHGVAEDRLAPVGVGPLSPVAPNDTDEGRAQNRRIEAILIN